jgi:hypothetical protein
MSEFDPYAPPAASEDAVASKPRKKKKRTKGDIAEALARLDEHLADPAKVATDRKAEGKRIRTVTAGFLVLGVLFLVYAGVAGFEGRDGIGGPLSVGFGAFITLIGALALVMDLRLQPRTASVSPEDTLKFFFRALALGRDGYAWSCLCPTARDQIVEPPRLGPIPTNAGQFTLATPGDVKRFAATFLRPGGGQMRSAELKSFRVVEQDEDVVRVEAHVIFQSFPQWLSVAGGVSAAMMRNLGLLGAVMAIVFFTLLFVMRKRYDVRFKRTLLRGRNGAFYLYKADVFEDGPEEG